MEYLRLKDVCDINMGQSPTSDSYNDAGDGVPFFQGNADFGDRYPITRKWCNAPTKMAQPGDILISVRAPIGAINYAKEECCIGRGLAAVTPDRDKVSPDFVFWFLKGKKEELNSKGTGSTFKAISRKVLEEILVPNVDLKEQSKYAEILEKIYFVQKSQKQELKYLDDLIKARFVEMFGDIKTNEYGWEKCTFKDVSTKITDGEHGTVPRVDEGEGYLYFMARNITKEGEIDLSETSFVPREIHEKIYKRCNPEKDDLLLVCVGATIGKCTLVSEIMGEFSMARSVALIKPNKEMVTSNFLINLLRSEAIQNDIDHCSHAAAQAGLYTNMINSLEAFVPPMDLQIEFDTFCEQVYKSKVAVQKALDETQLLFDSLMQEYFG